MNSWAAAGCGALRAIAEVRTAIGVGDGHEDASGASGDALRMMSGLSCSISPEMGLSPARTIWTRAVRSQTTAARENARQAAGLLRARRAELEEVEQFLLEERQRRPVPAGRT